PRIRFSIGPNVFTEIDDVLNVARLHLAIPKTWRRNRCSAIVNQAAQGFRRRSFFDIRLCLPKWSRDENASPAHQHEVENTSSQTGYGGIDATMFSEPPYRFRPSVPVTTVTLPP